MTIATPVPVDAIGHAPTRVLAVLEPGGAQLSAMRLALALGGLSPEHPLLVGQATPAGLALAAHLGVPVDPFQLVDQHEPRSSIQWRPNLRFADWLAPRVEKAAQIHAHMFGAWWAGAMAAGPETAVFASEHNEMSWPNGFAYTHDAEQAAQRLTAMFAHGPAARTFALRLLPEPRVLIGRSIVDVIEPVTERLSGGPRITFAGRFHEEKGPDVLLEAVSLMSARPSVHLIGSGTLRAQLERRIRLGKLSHVHLHEWTYHPEAYIKGSTVHVVPSREEAWSQSAVLGMRLGSPVLGTRVDGLQDTLADGRGVLVESGDPASMANALDRMLAGELQTDLSGACRYAAQFAADEIANHYRKYYAVDLSATTANVGTFDGQASRSN